jgi:gelsolin
MSERVPWRESNLALVGSELDHKIKAAAAEFEEQWQEVGKVRLSFCVSCSILLGSVFCLVLFISHHPSPHLLIQAAGLKIWRMEQFHVVPWPAEKYGSFHMGDSYIVLNSYTRGDSDALFHDVHIWIGSESSQDEYGTAAYKMVEADDFLGGAAVQHRQVQGHEAPLFQSYFDYDLTYMEGGTETGFNIVEPTEDSPHLYRVKGTQKGMSLTQVDLSKNSLSEGDAFILIANKGKVWLWNGKSANPDEKAKANSMAENMCTLGTVKTLDQGHGDDEEAEFWAYLGDGEIQEADDLDQVSNVICYPDILIFRCWIQFVVMLLHLTIDPFVFITACGSVCSPLVQAVRRSRSRPHTSRRGGKDQNGLRPGPTHAQT